MQSAFETYNIVDVHLANDNVFMIEHNDNGTYSWSCYQKCKGIGDLTDEELEQYEGSAYYDWADATGVEYSTIAEAKHSCDNY